MSEIVGGVTRPKDAPVDYALEKQPYLRQGRKHKEDWLEMKRHNRIIQGKLADVKREPPANFHAPLGYKSLVGGPAIQAQREGKPANPMPNTQHFVDVPPWPPKTVESAHITRSREQRRIDEENAKFHMKLNELYTSRRPRSAGNPGGIYREEGYQGVPLCAESRTMRTSLYLPQTPPKFSPLHPKYVPPAYAPNQGYGTAGDAAASGDASGSQGAQPQPEPATPQQQAPGATATSTSAPPSVAASGPGRPRPASAGPRSRPSPGRPASASSAAVRVPKTLGMASCAGCGAQGFYKGDGIHLEPCAECKQVWYCSAVCKRIDYPSHKLVCKWATTGQWLPYGKKPAEEYWVNSAAMAAGLKELRRRGKAAMTAAATGQPPTLQAGRQRSAFEGAFDDEDVVRQIVAKARAKEQAAEARQKAVEDAAYWGLDGPRPCMYMGGKPI